MMDYDLFRDLVNLNHKLKDLESELSGMLDEHPELYTRFINEDL